MKYQDTPIAEVSSDDWNIEVTNVATYFMVGDCLKNFIDYRDKDAK